MSIAIATHLKALYQSCTVSRRQTHQICNHLQEIMSDISNLSLCLDLDGTIIDTAPDLIRVLNLVIGEEGAAQTCYTQARKTIGYGARFMIKAAFERASHTVDEARITALHKLFLERYEADIAQLSRPFDGVLETLSGLKRGGVELSVCTNKPGHLARLLLSELGMSALFTRIIGVDDICRGKPHPDHIFASAGHRMASKIVMVGDASPDALAAKAAGVPCVLMAYGYSPIPCEHLGADVILRRFRDLPSALQGLHHSAQAS